MIDRRASGILVHPTSLPSPWGIGGLGPAAHAFIDWLADAGQRVWQILPLGPTGLGDSPYGALSAFAGNPLLISPELLQRDGLVQLPSTPAGSSASVDYGLTARWKNSLLDEAWRTAAASSRWKGEIDSFAERESSWLHDWALFAALREKWPDRGWDRWPEPYRDRDEPVLASARKELADRIERHRFVQFIFDRQWNELREHAHSRDILIMGDLPIYVAGDGAEVWSRPELFELDQHHSPLRVAGVPPDYFSPTGQRWGNPLYRWNAMKKDGYRWWIERMRANLRLTDIVRFDHFRGFAAYWAVPSDAPDARTGEWVQGPGRHLFRALEKALGNLPIVAEDLGTITPDVHELREAIGIPGMRVLQFAFGEDDSPHLPHHYTRPTVAYTGTHDNDTTVGWWRTAESHEKERAYLLFGEGVGREPNWTLIRAAWMSRATIAIAPIQDLFGLGSEARMNTPGAAEGNWRWRIEPRLLEDREIRRGLRRLTEITGRGDGATP